MSSISQSFIKLFPIKGVTKMKAYILINPDYITLLLQDFIVIVDEWDQQNGLLYMYFYFIPHFIGLNRYKDTLNMIFLKIICIIKVFLQLISSFSNCSIFCQSFVHPTTMEDSKLSLLLKKTYPVDYVIFQGRNL